MRVENRAISWLQTGTIVSCLAAGAIYGVHGLRDHLEAQTSQALAQNYWDKTNLDYSKYAAASDRAERKNDEANKNIDMMAGFAIGGIVGFGLLEAAKSDSGVDSQGLEDSIEPAKD